MWQTGSENPLSQEVETVWVGTESMLIFSLAVLESIVRYSMAACYGTLTVQLKNKLANLVRMAMKVMGQKDQSFFSSILEKIILKQAH